MVTMEVASPTVAIETGKPEAALAGVGGGSKAQLGHGGGHTLSPGGVSITHTPGDWSRPHGAASLWEGNTLPRWGHPIACTHSSRNPQVAPGQRGCSQAWLSLPHPGPGLCSGRPRCEGWTGTPRCTTVGLPVALAQPPHPCWVVTAQVKAAASGAWESFQRGRARQLQPHCPSWPVSGIARR